MTKTNIAIAAAVLAFGAWAGLTSKPAPRIAPVAASVGNMGPGPVDPDRFARAVMAASCEQGTYCR